MGKKKVVDPKAPVVNLLKPMRPDKLQELAEKFAAGETVGIGKLNDDRIPGAEWRAMIAERKAPALYHPALITMGRKAGALFALVGQEGGEQPDNWPSHLGEWHDGMKVDPFRSNHSRDLRKNVVQPEKHLLEVGKVCLVIGEGDKSAIFFFHGSKGDNTYAHNIQAAKSLAFRGGHESKALAGLCFAIATEVVTVPWTGDGNGGASVVCLPYQVATPVYIETKDGGKRITDYERIAKIFAVDENGKAVDADGIKAVKVVKLTEPIIGQPFTVSQLVQRVKQSLASKGTIREGEKETGLDRYESRDSRRGKGDKQTTEQGIATNANTQLRAKPQSAFCFGLRLGATASVLYACFGETRADKRLNVAIGLRSGYELTVAERQRVGAPEEADEAEEAAAEPKAKPRKAAKPKAPKVAKPKAEPKARKRKVKAEPEPTTTEPAAPVAEPEPATVGEPVAAG